MKGGGSSTVERQWDPLNMEYDALISMETVVFLAKVFLAASVVAFGPAVILEYVPTKRVDARNMVDAASPAGRTQRLLLAFAGGGLIAEAALHLLPHLFMPPHLDDHGHHGHDDDHHPHEQGFVDTYMLIAVGFLVTFAIDRFAGKKVDDSVAGEKSARSSTKEVVAEEDTVAVATAAIVSSPDEDDKTDAKADGGASGDTLGSSSEAAAEEVAAGSKTEGPDGDSTAAVGGETDGEQGKAGDTAHDSDDLGEDSAETAANATDTARTETLDAAAPTEDAVTQPTDEAAADASATTAPPEPEPKVAEPELTLYGNPKAPLDAETPAAEADTNAEDKPGQETYDETARETKDQDGVADKGHKAGQEKGHGSHLHHGHGGHHGDHGDAEGGAYATLAVDVLHNVIDGFGIGTAYTLGGSFAGHMTALLKLIHELQHEIGDVATLVQHGMSKHHAIHIQHTTAAGVFLGVAISLGADAFPAELLSVLLALSAGATFHLASGTILGPVLAIPARMGGSRHAVLELLALAAGGGGVVAIGLAEKMAGLGH